MPQLVEAYRGGMMRAGAHTLREVYDPSNAGLSPYGDMQVNSHCHAWSCTPPYLLRTLKLA